MRFGYTGSTIIRLAWLLFFLGATAALLTTLGLGLASQDYPGLDLPHSAIEQVFLILTLVAIWAIIGMPFVTSHEVRAGEVVLRQGILFHARVPYEQIEDATYAAKRPIGIGVRWYPDTLFVIAWPANLVAIRLRRRRSFRLIGLIPLPPVRTIVVNVDDPEAFLAALCGRLAAD